MTNSNAKTILLLALAGLFIGSMLGLLATGGYATWVRSGRLDEAEVLFEHLLSLRNDLGLLAEEYDPIAGRQLGNFPQAFSHVGLVNAAPNLISARGPAEQRTE